MISEASSVGRSAIMACDAIEVYDPQVRAVDRGVPGPSESRARDGYRAGADDRVRHVSAVLR
jgi:hypothetical protein